MKIIKLTACIMLVCATALSSMGQTKDLIITGTLDDMKEMPVKVYLVYSPFLHLPVDSAEIKDGKFKLLASTGGIVSVATLTTDLKFKTGPHTCQVVLDKGDLNLIFAGSLDQLTASGSAAGPELEWKAMLKEDYDKMTVIKKKMTSEQFTTDAAFKTATTRELYHQVSATMYTIMSYTRKRNTSVIAPYLSYMLISARMVTPAMADTLQQNLPASTTPELYKTEIAASIKEYKDDIAKATAAAEAKHKANDEKIPVGTKAMEFTLNDSKGKPVKLSSFKGKYVLVDFWASWCVPCRGENPNVVKAYNTYKAKGFTVLGISLDVPSQRNAWLTAIKKDGLTWTELVDPQGWKGDVVKLYSIESIPQNFLVDPDGVIIAKNLRGEDLQKKLASLFQK